MFHLRNLALCCVLIVLTASPCLAQVEQGPAPLTPGVGPSLDVTGVWDAELFGSKVVAHLEQDPTLVHQVANRYLGVVYVTNPLGETNKYTVAGLVFGDQITGQHGSGHVFTGAFQGEDAFAGELTLKDGTKLPLAAQRRPRTP